MYSIPNNSLHLKCPKVKSKCHKYREQINLTFLLQVYLEITWLLQLSMWFTISGVAKRLLMSQFVVRGLATADTGQVQHSQAVLPLIQSDPTASILLPSILLSYYLDYYLLP